MMSIHDLAGHLVWACYFLFLVTVFTIFVTKPFLFLLGFLFFSSATVYFIDTWDATEPGL